MLVTPNKKMTRWREWEETLLGIDGHFSNMESRTRPNGQASLAGERKREREAISYAAIIYSSLGMEEEAFTGMINIFGFNCARPAGHLSPQPASPPIISDVLSERPIG